MVAENIRRAREKQPRQETPPPKLKVNDLVLVKDPESAAFDPKYMPNYRITAVYGRNRIEVQDEKGNKSVRRAAHVKVCEPVDKVIHQLPPQAVYEQYGRRSKLLIHPKDVPEVSLQIFKPSQSKLEKIDECDESQNRAGTDVTVHEIAHQNGVGLKGSSSQPTCIYTIDASWNGQGQQQDEKCCAASFATNNPSQMDGDPSDESRNRVNVVTMYKSIMELRLEDTRDYGGTQKDIDASDESRCQLRTTTCNSDKNPNGQHSGNDSDEANRRGERTLQEEHSYDGDESKSRGTGTSRIDTDADSCWKFTHLAASMRDDLEGYQPSSTEIVGDGSISRGTRCSMSNPQ